MGHIFLPERIQSVMQLGEQQLNMDSCQCTASSFPAVTLCLRHVVQQPQGGGGSWSRLCPGPDVVLHLFPFSGLLHRHSMPLGPARVGMLLIGTVSWRCPAPPASTFLSFPVAVASACDRAVLHVVANLLLRGCVVCGSCPVTPGHRLE